MHTLELPSRFLDDHLDRCAEHHVGHHLEVIKWGKSKVKIELDDAALDEIESDADFYWSMWKDGAYEKELFGLCISAQATLKRIQQHRKSL